MHDANNLHILLHVTSHPIIEDSKGIVVGPYIDTQAEASNPFKDELQRLQLTRSILGY